MNELLVKLINNPQEIERLLVLIDEEARSGGSEYGLPIYPGSHLGDFKLIVLKWVTEITGESETR